MSENVRWVLSDEAATLALGKALAQATEHQCCWVALHGPLGAGKSTLVRGVLQYLGWRGAIPSPTYTLVEPYDVSRQVWHMDLYRLADESEWDELGVEDAEPDLLLIEWPSRVPSLAARFDLALHFDYQGAARLAVARPNSLLGSQILEALRVCFTSIT